MVVAAAATATASGARTAGWDTTVGGSGGGLAVTMTCEKLPEPTEFGDGNPFLMFLCLVRYSAVIIRH